MTDITPEHRAELERIGRIVREPSEARREFRVRLLGSHERIAFVPREESQWHCQHDDRRDDGDGWGASPLAAYASYLGYRREDARKEIDYCAAELARIGAEVTP